jgi:hypothetical protein
MAVISVYIDDRDLRRIKKHCKETGKKVSPFLVRNAISYLNNNKHLSDHVNMKRGIFSLFSGDD